MCQLALHQRGMLLGANQCLIKLSFSTVHNDWQLLALLEHCSIRLKQDLRLVIEIGLAAALMRAHAQIRAGRLPLPEEL